MELLKQIELEPEQVSTAIKNTVLETRIVEEATIAAEARARVEKDLGPVPESVQLTSQNNKISLETVMESLKNAKPEIKEIAIKELLLQHYGIETKNVAAQGLPYKTLEQQLADYEQQIENYPKKSSEYSKNILYGMTAFKNLDQLMDANIINIKDALIYKVAIKKIDQALSSYKLKNPVNHKFLRSLKKGAFYNAAALAIGSSLALGSQNFGIAEFVVCSGVFFSSMITFSVCSDAEIHGTLYAEDVAEYKKSVAQHLKKHGRTLGQDINVAIEYAQKLQRQLENPANINVKYLDSLEFLSTTKRQTQEYLNSSLETLAKLKEEK